MPQAAFRFDEFELDTENCELLRSGHHVKLERIPMQLLILLLENPGKLIRREAIVERLWGNNVFVESEHSINTAVNKLRAILRDDSRNPRFIRTVVGQGYCFIAKVHVLEHIPSNGTLSAAFDLKAVDTGTPSTTRNGHEAIRSVNELSAAPADSAGTAKRESQLQESSTVSVSKPFNGWLWIITGLILSSVLLAVAGYVLHRGERILRSPQEAGSFHSVAVLPFRNLAQTSDRDYLVDGFTDQLTTNLARSTSLRVISQRSAMQYKSVQKPVQEIAKELNVDAIVEGSYLHAGKQVRITAQLLDARNDRHVWAQTYNESVKDLLGMQDQVASDIAQQVSISLGGGFRRSQIKPTNPRAWDAFLRGRYFWNERTLSSITSSVKYYTEAIRQDPGYADAYAALAKAYVVLAVYGNPDPSDYLWKGQYAAERALELDSSLGEAHVALGAIKVERDWDWEGAEKEYKLGLQWSPADPTAHHWYSLHLTRIGKPEEAEVEIQRAIALDPLSLMIHTDAAVTAYWAGNPQEAMKRIEDVLVLNPDFAEAHLAKGKILEQLHRYTEAIAEYETAQKLFGGANFIDGYRAHAMAMAGKKEEALRLAKNIETQSSRTHISGSEIAVAYCALGQTSSAIKWLNRAYQQHERGMGMIGIDPLFDGCRSDPDFIGLLNRLRLVRHK
jgi:TolB-like protein/DNA-binding winged helix-turn-helix (wHTH) protein/Tfp pilus assembly protein PilF